MQPHRVLIVDDNPLNTDLGKFLLTSAGFEVGTADSARRALAVIPDFEPQLILMDIQMPGMDGLELTRLLKADPATRDIVIVAFTAYAVEGDEARMKEAGCDGYVSKPINVKTFAGEMKEHLDRRAT